MSRVGSAPLPDVADAIRRSMRANRSKDTAPELALRSLLHRAGYRFRVNVRGLPGTPDLVFTARRKAIWLHGCWWHAHPGCRHATTPKTRTAFWAEKFARNRQRDAENEQRLRAMRWDTLVIWECEMKDMVTVEGLVRGFLGIARHTEARPPSGAGQAGREGGHSSIS